MNPLIPPLAERYARRGKGLKLKRLLGHDDDRPLCGICWGPHTTAQHPR